MIVYVKGRLIFVNGKKLRPDVDANLELVESHNNEVSHVILDDVNLDAIDAVNRYKCKWLDLELWTNIYF